MDFVFRIFVVSLLFRKESCGMVNPPVEIFLVHCEFSISLITVLPYISRLEIFVLLFI